MKKIIILFHKWHNWVGIILSLPILIVSITALLIAFNDELGLRNIFINKKFFPGYLLEKNYNTNLEFKEIKSLLVKNDTIFIGSKGGLLIKYDNKIEIVNEFSGIEIRKILEYDNKIYIATKNGLYVKEKSNWSKILNKEVHDIAFDADGNIYASLGKEGIIQSNNMFNDYNKKLMSEYNLSLAQIKISNSTYKKNQISLKDLTIDLHTGKALFGKKLEWIWITIVSTSLFVLVFTGVYMWLRKKIFRIKKITSNNRQD
ncbi:MAG: PepSY domain-containing protein [Melioribacteraceae bacterium]|nr:PepSY domain-containing protein [Melioribacteraceae bacterium]